MFQFGPYILVKLELVMQEYLLEQLNPTVKAKTKADLKQLMLQAAQLYEVLYNLRKLYFAAFNRWYKKANVERLNLSFAQREVLQKMGNPVKLNFQFNPGAAIIYTNLRGEGVVMPARTVYAMMRASETLYWSCARLGNPIKGRIEVVPGMEDEDGHLYWNHICPPQHNDPDGVPQIGIGVGLREYLRRVDVVVDAANPVAVINRRLANSCMGRIVDAESGALLRLTLG